MNKMMASNNIIALDVGDRRVGVAVANPDTRYPRPLTTLENDSSIWDHLRQLIAEESVGTIVVGLPRGLDGQRTRQTEKAEEFANQVKDTFSLPVHMQDEALTSVKAKEELSARKKPFSKATIDALAAVYILDDFLQMNQRGQ